MQKEFAYFSQSDLWNAMWTNITIEQELEACNMHSPLRELFISYLPIKGKILEAGCGCGKWVIYLKQQGYDIMGIDNSELAVAKLRDFDESLEVELGDVLDMRCPDNYFDAYISLGVIEHFEDGPTLALNEAYRVLKPNGLVFVSVPTVNILRNLIRQPLRNAMTEFNRSLIILRSGWSKSKHNALRAAKRNVLHGWRRNRYRHFVEYRYLKSELENLMEQSGFEIIKTVPDDYYGSKYHAVGLVVDFPFLGARNGVNSQLNAVGKLISNSLDKLSPWIACAMVLCIGRSKK